MPGCVWLKRFRATLSRYRWVHIRGMLWSGHQAISQIGPAPSRRLTSWIMNVSALGIRAALSTAGSLNVAAKL
jgi:hypothetical protein